MKRLVLALMLLCLSSLAFATTPNIYRDAAEETRFHALTSTLRCVMCQNESLADSQAPIAHDLRREILELMRQGKTDAQIRDYLVARYGEFVLYRPRLEKATWLLWFGPIGLLVVGGATVAFIVRRRASQLHKQASTSTGDVDTTIESSEEW